MWRFVLTISAMVLLVSFLAGPVLADQAEDVAAMRADLAAMRLTQEASRADVERGILVGLGWFVGACGWAFGAWIWGMARREGGGVI